MSYKKLWMLTGTISQADIDYLVAANLQVDLEHTIPEEYVMLVGRRLGKTLTQDYFARPRVYLTTYNVDEETFLHLRFTDRLHFLGQEYWYSPEKDLN